MRSSTPTGSMRRRISGLSAHFGALKALSSEELDRRLPAWRAGSAGSARRPGRCASAASCSRRRSRRRGSSRAPTGRACGRRAPRDRVNGSPGLRRGRRHQHAGDALEVLQAERRRRHRIRVADRFGQLARIGARRAFGREAQPRRRVLLRAPTRRASSSRRPASSRRESACSPTSSPTCRTGRSSGSGPRPRSCLRAARRS